MVLLGDAVSESSNVFPQSVCRTIWFEAGLYHAEKKELRDKGILKNQGRIDLQGNIFWVFVGEKIWVLTVSEESLVNK